MKTFFQHLCVMLFPPAAVAVIGLSLFMSTGCTTLSTQVGPRVAKAVNRYCQEPLSARLLLREQVNTQIAPNSVRVQCAGDPPETGIPDR